MSDESSIGALTKEQVLERYGDIKCSFRSYYKYTFTFAATAPDGAEIQLLVGGCGDDIYRYSVTRESFETLAANDWMDAIVRIGGKVVWCENRY